MNYISKDAAKRCPLHSSGNCLVSKAKKSGGALVLLELAGELPRVRTILLSCHRHTWEERNQWEKQSASSTRKASRGGSTAWVAGTLPWQVFGIAKVPLELACIPLLLRGRKYPLGTLLNCWCSVRTPCALPPAVLIDGDMWNSSHFAGPSRLRCSMGMLIGGLVMLFLIPLKMRQKKIVRKDGVYGFPSTLTQVTKVASWLVSSQLSVQNDQMNVILNVYSIWLSYHAWITIVKGRVMDLSYS